MVQLRGKVDPEKKTPWYAGMSLLDTEYESERSLQLERPVQPELLLRRRGSAFGFCGCCGRNGDCGCRDGAHDCDHSGVRAF